MIYYLFNKLMFMYNFKKIENLKFKHFIDDMVIDI